MNGDHYSEGFLERQEAIYRELVEKTDKSCSTYPIAVKMWERYKDALGENQEEQMDKYYFEANNELEGYDLIEKDAIDTSEGKLDAIIATVYDIDGLMDYLRARIELDKEKMN